MAKRVTAEGRATRHTKTKQNMKQVVQNIRNGNLSIEDVPTPVASPGQVLIANQYSLISAGTEKMVMDLARKSLLGKARERPDQVRRVLEKIRNEGFWQTVDQVRKKLDEPIAMGYSSAGIVIATGHGVQEFKPGDRIASNGPHADVVSVPRNLCAFVPDNVTLDHACFAVLGSIALHGLRLGRATLGETVFVIGLGLVGQLTVALAKAAGCRVVGADPDAARCSLARGMGAEVADWSGVEESLHGVTRGLGADCVVITASTKSNSPLEQACRAVRQKGRIVLVGVCELQFDRRLLYFKEAEFVISCSYGPGRYDANYEDRGLDYPAAYVRWTEQRNIAAVLDMMAQGALNVAPLVSHRFCIDDAKAAYHLMDTGNEPFLGIVLEYPKFEEAESHHRSSRQIAFRPTTHGSNKSQCAVLGAGNFARMVLLPAIHSCQHFEIATIVSGRGLNAAHSARSMGAASSGTDEQYVFGDSTIDTIFSVTRHDQHAQHVLSALRAGKNIFVEKPLCMTLDELREIETFVEQSAPHTPLIMVGFNRRFAPATKALKQHFSGVSAPLAVSIRFNSGQVPADHWTQHDTEGGGRVIGEACHAIDLAIYLTGSVPIRVYAESIADAAQTITDDQCYITMRHENGSISNIAYLAGGDKASPKERIEVFGGGRTGVIDDFRTVTTWRDGVRKVSKSRQQKGHIEEIHAFGQAITGQITTLIPWYELRMTSMASILAVQSLREGVPLTVA